MLKINLNNKLKNIRKIIIKKLKEIKVLNLKLIKKHKNNKIIKFNKFNKSKLVKEVKGKINKFYRRINMMVFNRINRRKRLICNLEIRIEMGNLIT
jgi:hypothetical protein